MMNYLLFLLLSIFPILSHATIHKTDTISKSDFKGKLSEFHRPCYKDNDGKLSKKESRRHSLLVYGAAYLHQSQYMTDYGYIHDIHDIDEISEKVEENFVYMVIDTITNTFYWVDSGFENTHERNTIFGMCKIEGEVLYLQAEYSSRTIPDNNKRSTIFGDSIGLIYSGNDINSKKKRIKEYKFIITEDQLRDITDWVLPWETSYQEWEKGVRIFDKDTKFLPPNPQMIMFHSPNEELYYPSVLYRIDLGPKNRNVVNDIYILR